MHQETQLRTGKRVQPNTRTDDAEKRGALARRNIERKNRNLHPSHRKNAHGTQTSALSAARNCINGADDGAVAQGFRQPLGHLPQ